MYSPHILAFRALTICEKKLSHVLSLITIIILKKHNEIFLLFVVKNVVICEAVNIIAAQSLVSATEKNELLRYMCAAVVDISF